MSLFYLQGGDQFSGDIWDTLRIGDCQDLDGDCLTSTELSVTGDLLNENFEALQCCNIHVKRNRLARPEEKYFTLSCGRLLSNFDYFNVQLCSHGRAEDVTVSLSWGELLIPTVCLH